MPCVYFYGDERAVMVEKGMTLLESAEWNKVPHYADCGGQGKCSTCRVKIFSGIENLSSRTEIEQDLSKSRNWGKHIRLACQSRIFGDIVLERLLQNETELMDAYLEEYNVKPPVDKEVCVLAIRVIGLEKYWNYKPHRVFGEIINKIISMFQNTILICGGKPETFRGDSLVAYFGLLESNQAEEKIIRASFLISSQFAKMNRDWKESLDLELGLAMGIHQGVGLIAGIGLPETREVKVLGEVVSKAWSLVGYSERLGVMLVVSENYYSNSKEKIDYIQRYVVQSKKTGKKDSIYKPGRFGEPDDLYMIFELFLEIQDRLDNLAGFFYDQLFAVKPSLQELFKEDTRHQKKVFVSFLNMLMFGLNRMEEITPMLVELGKKHKSYGLKEADYPVFRDTLLQLLRFGLRENWDEVKERAFKKILDKLSQKMLKGFIEEN